jgi:death-on-curing protein
MRYLSGEEILAIHSEIIDETGGLHGIRDPRLLVSIAERPKMKLYNLELYKTLFDKAAVYLESLARYHIFFDGNKRTAIAASARFLFLNGFELVASNEAVEEFVLDAVIARFDVPAIALWLKQHSRPIRKR